MRLVDARFTFPAILFALLLAVTMGQGLRHLVIAISLLIWASFARVIRGEVLALKAARLRGARPGARLLAPAHHADPHPAQRAQHVHGAGHAQHRRRDHRRGVAVSFLGAGIPPPTPTWGLMVSEGRGRIADAWWVALIPGIAITLMVLSVNLFGDWLRDWLDPRLRQL